MGTTVCNNNSNDGFTPRTKKFFDLSPRNNIEKPKCSVFRLKAFNKNKDENNNSSECEGEEDNTQKAIEESESSANLVKDSIKMKSICNLQIIPDKNKPKNSQNIFNDKRARCFSGYGMREYQNFTKDKVKNAKKRIYLTIKENPNPCFLLNDLIPSYEDVKLSDNKDIEYLKLKSHMEHITNFKIKKKSPLETGAKNVDEVNIEKTNTSYNSRRIYNSIQPLIGLIDNVGRFELNIGNNNNLQEKQNKNKQDLIKNLEKAYKVTLDNLIKISLTEYARIKKAEDYSQKAYEILRIKNLLEANRKTHIISYNQFNLYSIIL